MNISLPIEARTDTGKGIARKLRAEGRVPGVIYRGGDEAKPVTLDPQKLLEIFRKTRNANTVLELDLGGETIRALVKEAQRHPVSREVLHVDFFAVVDDEPVVVMVPVRGVGRPKGAQQGGRLQIIRRELKVRCTWDKIPATIDVDVSPLMVGDIRQASELTMPEGVEHIYDNDFNVLRLIGKRGGAKS